MTEGECISDWCDAVCETKTIERDDELFSMFEHQVNAQAGGNVLPDKVKRIEVRMCDECITELKRAMGVGNVAFHDKTPDPSIL